MSNLCLNNTCDYDKEKSVSMYIMYSRPSVIRTGDLDYPDCVVTVQLEYFAIVFVLLEYLNGILYNYKCMGFNNLIV